MFPNMEVNNLRTLAKMEQELFEFALKLAAASPDRNMASMAKSALDQEMYSKLFFATKNEVSNSVHDLLKQALQK